MIRIITETGLRIYKELVAIKKDQVDLENRMLWIPDSKTPNGVAEVPLTELAVTAFRDQIRLSGDGPYLFPSELGTAGHLTTLKTAWRGSAPGESSVFSDLRSAFDLCHAIERGRRR